MRRETLLDFFEDFATCPAEFLIHDDGFRTRRYSYAGIARQARAFARRLEQAGIPEGGKVVFFGENRPEWIIALWGCLLRGAVAVPIDYRSPLEFLERVRSKVDARIVLLGDDAEKPADLPEGVEVWPFSSLADDGPGEFTAFAARNDSLTEIIFTSGATAEPKGVLITHRNVLANIVPVEREVHKYRKWGKPFFPLRFLNLLPLSHMFGQAMATFIPPMLPGIVVFLRGYNPHDIVRQIRMRRVSVLVSVPKILDVLREHVIQLFPELKDLPDEKLHWTRKWWRYRKVHRLFGWKFWSFIAGAAPLDPDLEAFWSKLGFLVIQGYGLTETAPIVTLNHPFHAKKGTVGTPIGGVKVKIAADGEILVRGDNVTSGYYEAPGESAQAFEDGWFHTGDIGAMDETGSLKILGRKKEMIVTPEGLNVFPEDVETVLLHTPGVRDAAVIGTDRVHAVLILEDASSLDRVVGEANNRLADHQKIRSASLWPYTELPRTEGTGKLKRREIAQGSPPPRHESKYDPATRLDALSSLERVELMVALNVDEASLAQARTIGEVQRQGQSPAPAPPQPFRFPSWNRRGWARAVRRIAQPFFLLPLTRIFARLRVEGLENLENLPGPAIFAPNHQSHLDVPAILSALPPRWRYRVAPAMSKEFFQAHFFPKQHSAGSVFTNSLNYYLSTLLFFAFPLPQREAGALDTLRYMGEMNSEGACILIFPEGKITTAGEINTFQPGVGMLAARLKTPVVPVKITGLNEVLPRGARMARRGRVTVKFGRPLLLNGSDYAALARQVEDAVRAL
ncbi:MAG TPA: AMP-binding protein [Bryobacteraceae bacterium]|jgi:long-chain acyl-CoA synthetase|nr:AMP-binding protein [Bryobacteraceae bacterium]